MKKLYEKTFFKFAYTGGTLVISSTQLLIIHNNYPSLIGFIGVKKRGLRTVISYPNTFRIYLN